MNRQHRMKLLLAGSIFSFSFSSISYGADLTTEVNAGESLPLSQNAFKLPEDTTQWQAATTKYMASVLSTPKLKALWQEFVESTMPIDGQFKLDTIPQREKNIMATYNFLNEGHVDAHVAYLEFWIDLHKK